MWRSPEYDKLEAHPSGQGSCCCAILLAGVTAAAAVAAALGCTAPRGSLAILGHQARVAGPRCAGAGVTGALQIPSLDASEAKRQLSIGDKVRLQQSGGPLRSCTMMVTIAVVKHSVSDRTLRLQPGVVAGGLLGCA